MGGDSASSNEYGTTNGRNPKVWRQGDYLLGLAGVWGLGQAVKSVALPNWFGANDMPLGHFMETTFARTLDEAIFRDYGDEAGLLVGYQGHLFQVDNHYGVFEPVLSFLAMGTGGPYAMGALYADNMTTPKSRILNALGAAAFFAPGFVRPPFTVLGPQ